eukprot:m.160115 g.160115  ORF g.160115 m.160115 type:complete len:880 (-) comp18013_c0_seq1:180-2819(-)
MASKLSFRARAIDASRPLPIYRSEHEPEILNEAAINRGIMELPTGMEKEEEEEVHIAQAMKIENPMLMSVVIPIPESTASSQAEGVGARAKFKLPKQYIRQQLSYGMEDEVPTYDLDSDDEEWLHEHNEHLPEKFQISPEKFELIFGKIESMLIHGPVSAGELTAIAGKEERMYKVIYEYMKKRLKKLGTATVTPMLKQANRDGSSARDAYVAFRGRTERMQTRKNLKNVEGNYMNMLKLHRDMIRCREIMALVRRREKQKHDLLSTRKDVIEHRMHLKDWTGALVHKLTPQPVIRIQLGSGSNVKSSKQKNKNKNADGDGVNDQGSAESDPGKRKKGNKHKKRSRSSEDTSLDARIHPDNAGDAQAQKSNANQRAGKSGKKRSSQHQVPLDDEAWQKGVRATDDSDGDDGYTDGSSAITDDEYTHDEPFRLRRRYNMFYHAPLATMPSRISEMGQYALVKPGFSFLSDDDNIEGPEEKRAGAGNQVDKSELHASGSVDTGEHVSNGVAGGIHSEASVNARADVEMASPTASFTVSDAAMAMGTADAAKSEPSAAPSSEQPMDHTFTTPPPDPVPPWAPPVVVRPYKHQRSHPAMSGYCRRRIGRGGRVFIDRCRPDYDMFHELTHLTEEQQQDRLEQRHRVQRAKVLREHYERQRALQKEKAEHTAIAMAAETISGSGGSGRHATQQGEGSAVSTVSPSSSDANGALPGHHRSGPPVRGGGWGGVDPATHAGSSTMVHGNRGRGRGSGPRRGDSFARAPGSSVPPSTGTKSGSHGNPYAKSYNGTPTGRTNSRERISAFPLAGSDFGAGGENVSDGPLVRIVTTQPADGDSDGGMLKQSNWLPVSSAAHAVQKSKGASARGGVAFAGSSNLKRKRKEK